MEFDGTRRELYCVMPKEFTAARDAKVSEARAQGNSGLANSLKGLRKPSVGAWLANLLVREQAADVQRLINLGAELRVPKRKLEGANIRRVSKEKADAVAKLVRDAKARASRMDQPASAAALEELETTLEAAFADERAADSLLGGQLSTGLRYSGLGLGADASSRSASRAKVARSSRRDNRVVARQELERANREAERADTEVAKVRQAIAVTEEDLKRLKSDEARAVRRSSDAHKRATAVEKGLSSRR